jgi:hypothetical protein
MVKVTEIVYNYQCEQCNIPVIKGKNRIYCGICGKKLCKKCGKSSICEECAGEISKSELKIINGAVKKNRILFWIYLSPMFLFGISFLLAFLVEQLELNPELEDIINIFGYGLIFISAFGFIPGFCLMAFNLNSRYSKVLKKIASLPIPTYESYYKEFNGFFEPKVEMALSQYPKKQRWDVQKRFYGDDAFITPIIQEFVDMKAASYPNFRERIVRACNDAINNRRQLWNLFH